MKAYVDKEILESVNGDLLTFCSLLREMDTHFNFSRAEFPEHPKLGLLFKLMYDNDAPCDYPKPTFSEKKEDYFPTYYEDPNTHKDTRSIDFIEKEDFAAIDAVYLLNPDPDILHLKEQHNRIIATSAEEIKQYFKILNKLSTHQAQSINIKSWKEFICDLPITDVLVVDPFLFANKDHFYKTEDLLLTLSNRSKNSTINIIILAGFDDGVTEERFEEIKEYLNKNNGKGNKISLSIALNGEKDWLKPKSYHDRYIITNYYRISCGHGINFINNGDPNEDSMVQTTSHVSRVNAEKTYGLMLTYIRYIYDAEDKEIRNKTLIGDFKTCQQNLLMQQNRGYRWIQCDHESNWMSIKLSEKIANNGKQGRGGCIWCWEDDSMECKKLENLCKDIRNCIEDFNKDVADNLKGKEGGEKSSYYWITVSNQACYDKIKVTYSPSTNAYSGVYFKSKELAMELAHKIKDVFAKAGYDIQVLDETESKLIDGQEYEGVVQKGCGKIMTEIAPFPIEIRKKKEDILEDDKVLFTAHREPNKKTGSDYWYASDVRLKED
ncbi:MAG: hypothetical protein MJZ64_05205 [Paludibacteraceae bacterium]|nr:hypothetical protein [Paludibacteraceae bacterium]